MDIMERLEILKTCDIVDERGYKDLLTIIKIFEARGIQLTEENGGTMITHIAAAIKRLQTKEVVEALDPFLIEQLKEEASFQVAEEIAKEIVERMTHKLSEEEYLFILVHTARVVAL